MSGLRIVLEDGNEESQVLEQKESSLVPALAQSHVDENESGLKDIFPNLVPRGPDESMMELRRR